MDNLHDYLNCAVMFEIQYMPEMRGQPSPLDVYVRMYRDESGIN